jgi:hypothetical protein
MKPEHLLPLSKKKCFIKERPWEVALHVAIYMHRGHDQHQCDRASYLCFDLHAFYQHSCCPQPAQHHRRPCTLIS